MSYDLSLLDPVTKEVIQLEEKHHMYGGTYAIGGTHDLWLNVTYNYSSFYYRENTFGEKGIYTLDGMTGAESMPLLKKAIENLGDDVSSNYWDATEGNAKQALCKLLALANMCPDGVWKVA